MTVAIHHWQVLSKLNLRDRFFPEWNETWRETLAEHEDEECARVESVTVDGADDTSERIRVTYFCGDVRLVATVTLAEAGGPDYTRPVEVEVLPAE